MGSQGHAGHQHPECGDTELELEGELALARGLIASGEYSHGAKHAAGCLAMDPGHPEVVALLDDLHRQLGELAPDVVEEDPEKGLWTGEAALRAWMLRANGRTGEATVMMVQVMAADVAGPWAGLLRSWVESDPDFPLPVPAMMTGCAAVIDLLLHRTPDEAESRAVADFTVVLERSLAQHPDHGWLRSSASGVARRAGREADAVRWAEDGDRLEQTMLSACMLGYARRSAGDEQGAAAAFALASEREPKDPSPRLDAADSFANLEQWDSAAAWSSSAWRLDPDLATAAARAEYWGWKASGDPRHVLRLVDWVLQRCPRPDDELVAPLGDALSFVGRAHDELPWVVYIPVPSNAALNIARQIADQDPESRPTGGGLRMSSTMPEAPSALLALEHVVDGTVEVITEGMEVPEPDPRLPRRDVAVCSWRLDGDRLVPGVPAPTSRALAAMHLTPTWLYTIAHARRDADQLVATQQLTADDLVALATHPQPGPSEVEPWQWLRRWQVVCCYALGALGAFDVLTDLADGPEDWLSDAALAGLVELARRQPGRRADVLHFALEHLNESTDRLAALDLPHFGSECDLFTTIPEVPADIADTARKLRASWAET